VVEANLIFSQPADHNVGISHFPQHDSVIELPGEKLLQCRPELGPFLFSQGLAAMFDVFQRRAGFPVKVLNTLPGHSSPKIGFNKTIASGDMLKHFSIVSAFQSLSIFDVDEIVIEIFFAAVAGKVEDRIAHPFDLQIIERALGDLDTEIGFFRVWVDNPVFTAAKGGNVAERNHWE